MKIGNRKYCLYQPRLWPNLGFHNSEGALHSRHVLITVSYVVCRQYWQRGTRFMEAIYLACPRGLLSSQGFPIPPPRLAVSGFVSPSLGLHCRICSPGTARFVLLWWRICYGRKLFLSHPGECPLGQNKCYDKFIIKYSFTSFISLRPNSPNMKHYPPFISQCWPDPRPP